MANYKKTVKANAVVNEETVDENEDEVIVETPKKKFEQTDGVMCRSITNGLLNMIGQKTGIQYRWFDYGDETEVEYRDLVAAIREHTKDVFEPRFIIQDDDFLAKYDTVQLRYGELYTPADIEQVLSMPPSQMETMIKKMPVGAQNALRDLASRKIDSGEFDSINRVRVIDSFFGTQLVLKLTQ